ncbi:MAG: 50S ribosomal protein L14 [Rickettsiales bacterium]
MIKIETVLDVVDNSGAKTVKCIKLLGGGKKKHGSVGDVIVVAVQTASPTSKIKKGTVHYAVISSTRYPVNRKNGTCVKFPQNGAILLNKSKELIGTRIFGSIAQELKNDFNRAVSLAANVL